MFKLTSQNSRASVLPTDHDFDFIAHCETACSKPGGSSSLRSGALAGFQSKARTEVIAELDRLLRDARPATAKPVPA